MLFAQGVSFHPAKCSVPGRLVTPTGRPRSGSLIVCAERPNVKDMVFNAAPSDAKRLANRAKRQEKAQMPAKRQEAMVKEKKIVQATKAQEAIVAKQKAMLDQETILDGPQVYVTGLPKKLKMLDDLAKCFRGTPGLSQIRPVNEKGRNEQTYGPTKCKGMAYVTFESQEDADSFIAAFDGKTLTFGKVGKVVSCEVARSKPLVSRDA